MCVYIYIYIYIYMGDPGPRAPGSAPPCTCPGPSLGGVPRGSQTASKRTRTASRRPQEAPKMVQEGPETPKDRSKTPTMVPRQLKWPLNRAKRPPRGLPRGPQETKFIGFQ